MPPYFAGYDPAYGRLPDSELIRKASLPHSTKGIKAADFTHISVGKGCTRMVFAAKDALGMSMESVSLAAANPFRMCASSVLFATSNPAFPNAIRCVLPPGAKKKVDRVTAQGAVAMVTNAESIGDFTEVDEPTQAVSRNVSLENRGLPVSVTRSATDPQPAFLWCTLLHFRPKAVLDLGRDLWQKVASRFRSHTAVWVRAPRLLKQSRRSLFLAVWP
jgi:hypothetical protein